MPRPRVTPETEQAVAGYVSCYVEMVGAGVSAVDAMEAIGSAIAGVASAYSAEFSADAVIGLVAVAVGLVGDGVISRQAAGG